MHLHGNANRHVRQNARRIAAMQISHNTAVILGCSPSWASLEGWKRAPRPSFETPRKRTAPQDDG
jgi:hypothetical protein